jgi:hypothetical protein
MFNPQEDWKDSWRPYIIVMTATAILTTIGNELARWAVHELKEKFGSKKEKHNQ